MACTSCPFGLKNLTTIWLILSIVALACGCACPGQPRGSGSKWFERVSEADRAKLHQLREMVKDDPAVRLANEKRNGANDEYHEVLRVAILKRDPSLAPVLDQIRKRCAQREKSKAD